jgi:precorrin-6B methylase 2
VVVIGIRPAQGLVRSAEHQGSREVGLTVSTTEGRSQPQAARDPISRARAVGYSKEEVTSVPPEAILGRGCGNPVALATLREGEVVVDMFAGVGPYAIEIARAHSGCSVVAIELNKEACRYLLENVKLNKAGNVIPVQGNVRRVAERYRGFADRIVMPLPKTSSSFLEEVLVVAKPRCTVHYYTFCKTEGEEQAIGKIKEFFTSHGKKFNVLGMRMVRPYSANEIEIVVDFRIWRAIPGKLHNTGPTKP